MDEREIRLPLPAQANRSLVLIAAYPLTQDGVFDKNAEREQVELSVLSNSRRPIRVLEQVRR